MVFAPILSLVLMVLGSGFFMSFISLYFKETNLGDFQIGLAHSSFYLGLLVSSLRAEHLISRVGHIRALTATCGILSASTLVLMVIPPSQWFWFRFLSGACVGCFYVALESWLLTEYPASRRGSALAIYTISIYVAQSGSQLLLPLAGTDAALAFTVSAALASLAVVPVSIGKNAGPELGVADPVSIIRFFKISPLGVTGCLIAGMLLSSLYAYLPLFFEEKHYNTGLLMAVLIIGGALLQWPIGKLSDRTERRKVLTFLAGLGALSAAILMYVERFEVLTFGVFIMGGLIFTIYPVAMALGCDCVEPKDIVKMTGVLLFSYGLGAVLGPVLTPLANLFGQHFVLFSASVYCVALFLVGIYSLKTRDRIAIEDQSDFTAMPTGPMLEDLHPSTSDLSLPNDEVNEAVEETKEDDLGSLDLELSQELEDPDANLENPSFAKT